jgi:hypothetical protein
MRTRGIRSALLLAIAATAAPAWADDASLRRCRAIADATSRLACYDALPVPGVAAPPRSAPPKAVPPGHSPFRQPPPVAPAERFGLEYKAKPAEEEVATIESTIPGRFEGWRPNTRIRLANGQVWQVIDETSRYMVLDNPKVVVRRGMLGAFFLDIEGDNRSPRVRRVQ